MLSVDSIDRKHFKFCFPREVTQSLSDEINRLFALEEIMLIVQKLRNNKAHGVDNIINEGLKNCPPCAMSLM